MGRRRGGEGGGKCGSRDQPPFPTSHCERDKTRALRGSHAHAHTDDPVASSLRRCRESQPNVPFLGRGGSASSERSPEPTQKAERTGAQAFFLPCRPGLRRPSPALNPCLSHPTLLGLTRTESGAGCAPVRNPRFSTSDSAREPRALLVGHGERSTRRETAF